MIGNFMRNLCSHAQLTRCDPCKSGLGLIKKGRGSYFPLIPILKALRLPVSQGQAVVSPRLDYIVSTTTRPSRGYCHMSQYNQPGRHQLPLPS